MTQPDEFAALRAALEAGPTPGPWHQGADARSIEGVTGTIICNVSGSLSNESVHADAAYIAAANPEVIASLLAGLDAARADAERWRHVHGSCDWVLMQSQKVGAGWPSVNGWTTHDDRPSELAAVDADIQATQP